MEWKEGKFWKEKTESKDAFIRIKQLGKEWRGKVRVRRKDGMKNVKIGLKD